VCAGENGVMSLTAEYAYAYGMMGSGTVNITNTMTKADIVEHVYASLEGFSKKESAEIVDIVFEKIKETLERGEKIKISGFGNFVVRQKDERTGRNPQTGQEIKIAPRRVLTFKPSQVLKNSINS